MDWNEFDKKVDITGINADIKNAEKGSGTFEAVPHGTYEVAVNKLELKMSKSNKPMLSGQFKILAGPNKNRLIFMNQLVDQGFKIHIANELLCSLESGVNVNFAGYADYNDMVMDIKEAIDEQKLEYALNYSQNEKGFDVFKIEEVFSNK